MSRNKRKEFEDAVWNRIEDMIKEKKIKQSELVRKCKEIGMPITQPEFSKLYNGTKKINLYELTAISEALNVPMDFFVSGSMPYQENFFYDKESKNLLSEADNERFAAYFGEYYVYYNATTEQKKKVQCGRMIISREKNGQCKIELLIYTGTYQDKREVVKKYEGCMLITTLLAGAYIVVRNDSIGELSFMIMRYRAFTVDHVKCRMALCLTIGTGENKLPTAHKMMISRKRLSHTQIENMKSYFDLYGDAIRIEKNKALTLASVLEDDAEIDALNELWKVLPEKQYYEVSIELLRRHLHLSGERFAIFIASLLQMADTEPYFKLRETDDSLTYAIIDNLTTSESGVPPDE